MRMMYKDSNNRVYDTKEGAPGQTIIVNHVGDLEWIEFSAASIAYNDNTHMGVLNIEEAIQTAFGLIGELKKKFDKSDLGNLRTTVGQSEANYAELNRVIRGLAQAIEAQKHEQLTLSDLTNPALSVDANGQVIALNLRVPGSYKNIKSGAQVDNIQDAIDDLYNLARIASVKGNQIQREKDGGLSVKQLQITTNPSLIPVEVNGNVINLYPTVIAHIRRANGNKLRLDAGWTAIKDLPEIMIDTLAQGSENRQVLPGGSQITILRAGYYLLEAAGPVKASLAVNDNSLEVDRVRTHLRLGDKVSMALYSEGEAAVSGEVSLFAQWLA